MNDEELFSEFDPVYREGINEGVADAMRRHMRAKNRRFLPVFDMRRKIVGMMNHRFPEERDAIIDAAEASIAGKFSLLGHANLIFGDPPEPRSTGSWIRFPANALLSDIGASCIH